MRDVSEEDPFGRLLRYVYVDDILVNAELVREGYARAVKFEPDVKYLPASTTWSRRPVMSAGACGHGRRPSNRMKSCIQ